MNEIARARLTLLCLTGLAYAMVLPLPALVGMKTDLSGLAIPSLVLALSVALLTGLCSRIAAIKLRAVIETYFFTLLLILPETLSVYSAAHLHRPWADLQLSTMDRALGWDWKTAVLWIDSHALLAKFLTYAYFSFGFQAALLPIVLSLSGHIDRAYQMTIMSAVMCFICALVSIWYPAMGTYAFYNFDLNSLQNLGTYAPTVFIDQLVAVHDDPDFVFSLARVKGIVTFPSMHAAIAVLCVWAAWDLKPLRYPLLALNILMGCSAAIVANHYLIDLIGGTGVAGLSISAVLLLVRHETQMSFRRSASQPKDA